MAYDFGPESTLVLRYDPWEHRRAEHRQDLLWPAYAYRVLAPEVRERQLNVFQKAILGMCQGEKTDPADVGRLLQLDPDLVSLVLVELQDLRFLDQNLRVTADGERRLGVERDDLPESQQLTVGYVFQDPWSSRLWPRFVDTLQPADRHFVEGDAFPRLVIGSAGSPRHLRPFVKSSGGAQQPHPPTPREIVDAVWRHRRDLRSGRTYAARDSEDETETPHAMMAVPRLDRVTAISGPQCVYLSTFLYLYVFLDEVGAKDWHVCDPFAPGASPFLRRCIVQQMESDDGFRSWVEKLIGDALLQGETGAGEQLLEETVAGRLRTPIRFPALRERLVSLERACAGAHLDRDGGKCSQDKLEQVMLEAAKGLERLFACLLEAYPPADSWRAFMTTDRVYREELLNTLAEGLGFSTPLPMTISRVRPEGVKWAADKGGGTLGQRTVATLLASRVHDQHPLCRVSGQAPGLFLELDRLIDLRDRSAHDVTATLEKAQVREQVETTYRVIRLLAGRSVDREG